MSWCNVVMKNVYVFFSVNQRVVFFMRQIRIMRMRKIDLRRFFTYRLCKESIFKCSGYILYVHIEIFLI